MLKVAKGLFYGVLLSAAFSACVSNKRIVYLQKEDVNKKDLLKDTVVRSYNINQPEYKTQPEDILNVRFESLTPKELDFLNQSLPIQNTGGQFGGALLAGELVDRNGEIPFPFIGKIKVSGLSVYEIQDKLQKIAVQYLESPVVKVRLLNFRFTILGEVAKEGTIVFNNNRMSLLEAIGWAGGLGEFADRANLKIIRQENGHTTTQYIDLLKEDFINSPYYYVHQNDVIIVPALKQRSYIKYSAQNLSIVLSSLSILLLIVSLNKK